MNGHTEAKELLSILVDILERREDCRAEAALGWMVEKALLECEKAIPMVLAVIFHDAIGFHQVVSMFA